MPSSRLSLACCCGHDDCSYLKHNDAALRSVERSVQTAARLGQALLVRHETYMADAEKERYAMTTMIERLEMEKRDVERENASIVQENHNLLHQLEELNAADEDADAHIKALSDTLESTQREMKRLAGLAAKTSLLEVQLMTMEQERAELQQSLVSSGEDRRSAVLRWKSAERTLGNLQEQIERIEAEAEAEHRRHAEIVERLGRRREVEKEMDNPSRQEKIMTLEIGRPGGNVVSHFVKDILQDNANLQIGIVELRELLTTSNDEIQQLQEQLMLHQPIAAPTTPRDSEASHGDAPSKRALSLESELAPHTKLPQSVSQELHIHHHYHQTPRAVAKDKSGSLKRAKRRPRALRSADGSGTLSPQSELHTLVEYPNHSCRSQQQDSPSVASTILSHTSVSVPPFSKHNRWSTHSTQTALSSVPSSPTQSLCRSKLSRGHHHRDSSASIFDRAFPIQGVNVAADFEFSRPTSPESAQDPSSPAFPPTRSTQTYLSDHPPSSTTKRPFVAPAPFQPAPITTAQHTILTNELQPASETLDPNTVPITPTRTVHRPIHRSTSCDSLLSISGMDIHAPNHSSQPPFSNALCTRPSNPTLLLSRQYRPGPSSWQATTTNTTTRSSLSSINTTGSPSLLARAHVLSENTHVFSIPVASVTSTTATFTQPSLGASTWYDSRSYTQSLLQPDRSGASSVAKKSPWPWTTPWAGNAPTTNTVNARADARKREKQRLKTKSVRAPGVNQTGPILGLMPRVREIECTVEVGEGDWDPDSLRDALEEE